MHGHDVVGRIFSIERFLCCRTHEEKLSIQCLWKRFPPLRSRILFVVNTVTVFLSFCYIECELFAVFIKILLDN